MMPAAVLREAALRRNIAEMQAFADRQGAWLCPHGKTSMSPELFAMQLEAGAWGLTAATAHHVRVYRRLGISRIFLANQLAAPADIALVLAELERDAELDFYCLADSIQGVSLLAEAVGRARIARPLQLLVETGFPGGRAGVRGLAEALEVARAIAAAPMLALRGVETFEGIRQAGEEARLEAGEMLDLAVAAAEAAAQEGLLGDGPLLLSAGGSAFLDLCAAELPSELGGVAVQRVIRPGCYVTHDHGLYKRLTRPGGALPEGLPELEPALEVWGAVLSTPEPGLAIVGAGKRDLSFDSGLPRPLWVQRFGSGGPPTPAQALRTLSLWDQHLSLACPAGTLGVGDLVGFGISHPCATFDRWRVLLTVDEERRVTGAATTMF
jgi:D-serine dehydratase